MRRQFIIGVDTDWQNKASAKDREVILKGYTAGQQVKLRVIATNDSGDANPSPEVTVVVTLEAGAFTSFEDEDAPTEKCELRTADEVI